MSIDRPQDGRWRLRRFCGLASSLFFAAMAQAAEASLPEAQDCAAFTVDRPIEVIFVDRPLVRDDSLDLDALKRLSGSHPENRYHRVLGVTQAEPVVTREGQWHWRPLPGGQGCLLPSQTVRLSLARFVVYLARELQEPCRRQWIDAHEMEHVAVWRHHLRAGARLMQLQLRARFGQARLFPDQATGERALGAEIDQVLQAGLHSLHNSIQVAHREIDSPGSYGMTERQLRACP